MKRLLIWAWLLFTLYVIPAGAAAEDTANLSSQKIDALIQLSEARTAEWEQTYGPYVLWDYHINAQFGTAYHVGPGGNLGFLPVEPAADAIAPAEALVIAKAALYKQDARFNADLFATLTVSSAYTVANGPDQYFSQQGTWIFQFWSTQGNLLRKIGYVYVDAHTQAVPLLLIAIDQTAPDDYDSIRIIQNPG